MFSRITSPAVHFYIVFLDVVYWPKIMIKHWILLATCHETCACLIPPHSYLSVCQAEHGGQLLSVWLGDILLYLKSLLEPFPLQVGKHRPRPRPFPLVRLWHRVFREDGVRAWKTRRGRGVKNQKKNRNRREHSMQVPPHLQTVSRTGPAPCLSQSYMWWLPGKVSWNWCWPDCLLLLLPSELIMEGASLIPGSMEEKYWLAGGWTGMWIPDWRFELTMDVRSVTEREMRGYRSDTTSGVKDGLVLRERPSYKFMCDR